MRDVPPAPRDLREQAAREIAKLGPGGVAELERLAFDALWERGGLHPETFTFERHARDFVETRGLHRARVAAGRWLETYLGSPDEEARLLDGCDEIARRDPDPRGGAHRARADHRSHAPGR